MTQIPGNVFPRTLDKPLPVAKSAKGVWIEDFDGNRMLDASGGAVVVNLGHGRKEIAKAVSDQILKCHYAHPTMFTTETTEALAKALSNHTPKGIDRFYFQSSGSEAVETAIKLARQIQLAYGRSQRFRLISRWKSYHGLTLGALAATGRTPFRVDFTPMLNDAIHIPPPYCLRCSYGLSYPECNIRCATALEEAIQNAGPDTVSAFLAETVSGGTLAAYPPPKEYFPIIRQICDRYDVLLIMDEVMCGLGRTGKWYACRHYDVVPDLITMGKGLTGGTLALSCVGVQGDHFDRIREASGVFMHGGTFSHHPVAAAAGLAAVKILERENLVERVAEFETVLSEKLDTGLGENPWVGDIRGIGFMWGVELVKNKDTLEPFPRNEKVAERVWQAAFENGLIMYKSTGLAGIDGDALIIAPPFIIEAADMDYIVEKAEAAISGVLGSRS